MTFLFCGQDTYSLVQELEAEKQKLLKKDSELAVESLTVEGGEDDKQLLARLQEVFEAQTLFSPKKVIILKNFLSYSGRFSGSAKYLLQVLPQRKNNPVFLIQLEPFDRRLKYSKAVEKLAEIKIFEMPRADELAAWIKKFLKNEGYEIEPPAIDLILRNLGEEYDLWQVRGELEKLMLYTQGHRKITVTDVAAVMPVSFNRDVFALTNAVADGDVPHAVFILDHLVGDNMGAQKGEILQVLGALASQIRSLLTVKSFEGSSSELAKILGWKEGRVWINLKLARKFTAEKLRGLLFDLRAIDLRLKTSDEPAKLLLSLLIQKAKAL